MQLNEFKTLAIRDQLKVISEPINSKTPFWQERLKTALVNRNILSVSLIDKELTELYEKLISNFSQIKKMNEMQKHMVEFTGIEARLKNYGVTLTATGPDDAEFPLWIPGEDIRDLYDCNPAEFIQKYENNEAILYELFNSVHGIAYAE